MEAARAALDDAVAALFSTDSTAVQDYIQLSPCPGCGFTAELLPEWRILREFPVLTRSVITSWTRYATTLADVSKSKRRRDGGSSAMDLRVHSMSALCTLLFQAGVYFNQDGEPIELLQLLISTMATPFADVLRRVLTNRIVGVAARMVLLCVALSARRDVDSLSYTTIESVCTSLMEELLRQPLRADAVAPSKATRKRRREVTTRAAAASSIRFTRCEACQISHRNTVELTRTGLIQALTQWKAANEDTKTKNRALVTAVRAVDALLETLSAPDIVQSFVARASDTNGDESMSVNVLHDVPVPWQCCERVVDAMVITSKRCADGDDHRRAVSWARIWTRLKTRQALAKATTLGVAVRLCLLTDQLVTTSCNLADESPSLGSRVVVDTANAVNPGDATVLILCAFQDNLHRKQALSGPLSTVLLNNRHLVIRYLRYALKANPSAVVPTSKGSQDRTRPRSSQPRASHLCECLFLIQDIVEKASYHTDRTELFELWYAFLMRHCAQPPAPRSSLLATISDCAAQLRASASSYLDRFEDFAVDVLLSIVNSEGQRITLWTLGEVGAVPDDELSQSALLEAFKAVTCDETSAILSKLVHRLCVAATRQGDQRVFDAVGIQRFVLPTLNLHCRTRGLCSLVSRVSSQMKWSANRLRSTRALVYLLFTFDKLHGRDASKSTVIGAFDGELDRPGMQAAIQSTVWHDLVCYYGGASERAAAEPRPFLSYLSELLRSVDPSSCPREEEGSLFLILSQILSARTLASENSSADADDSVISHSDATLDRFLTLFEGASASAATKIVKQLQEDDKAEDLVLCLRRWLRMLQTAPSSITEATSERLILLANRLVFLGGDAFASLRPFLMPMDTVLLQALHSFATQSNSGVSIVRLNLLMRGYLSVSRVPDLIQLSSAMTEATLASIDASIRGGILKLQTSFAHCVLNDVVVAKLREALTPSVPDSPSSRALSNALAVIITENLGLEERQLPLSSELFPVEVAERWLSLFISNVCSQDSGDPGTSDAIGAFLDCLEALTSPCSEVDTGQDPYKLRTAIFANAHALVAMLTTIQVAVAEAELKSPFIERVRRLTQLIVPVHQPATVTAEPNTSLLCVAKQHQRRASLSGQDSTKRSLLTSGLTTVECIESKTTEYPELAKVPHWIGMATRSAVNATLFFLPFESWVASMFDWPLGCSDAAEAIAVDMVVQFYLPVQFHSDASKLTTEWIRTWLDVSLVRQQCLQLLPRLCRLLQHMLGSLPQTLSMWQSLQRPLHALLETRGSIPPVFIGELVTHITSSLDLALICSMRLAMDKASDLTEMGGGLVTLLDLQMTSSVEVFSAMIELFVAACVAITRSRLPSTTDASSSAIVERAVLMIAPSIQAAVQREAKPSISLSRWQRLVRRWQQQYSYLINAETTTKLFEPLLLTCSQE